MKRVGLYVRVSSVDQSTDMQLRELNQYVAAREWLVHHVYEDKLTGTNSQRPMLQELLKDARERKFDIILCWKLDRFFRSLKDLVTTLHELTELGIEFVSLKDTGIDMTTASGRLMVHLIGAFSEFEASLTRMRVRSGIANARARGKRLGRPPQINYQQVQTLRAQGFSLSMIAKQIGATKSGVSKILSKNPFPNPLKNTNTTHLSKPHFMVDQPTPSETPPTTLLENK